MVFFQVHPLADTDPASTKAAKAETPAAEAAAWLANPDAVSQRPPTGWQLLIDAATNGPFWTGEPPTPQPDPDEDTDE